MEPNLGKQIVVFIWFPLSPLSKFSCSQTFELAPKVICIDWARNDDSLAFKGVLDGQLYLVGFTGDNAELDTCLIAKSNMG